MLISTMAPIRQTLTQLALRDIPLSLIVYA
jgi:hypothetical protein